MMKEENDSLGSESEFYKLNGSEDREDDEDEEENDENDDQQEEAVEDDEEAEENEDEDEENNEPMNPMIYANTANKIPLNKTSSAPRAIINHPNSNNNKKQINRQQNKQAQPNKPSIIQSDSSILDNDNPLKLKIKLNKQQQQQQQQVGINRSRSNSSTSSTQSSSLSYSAAMKKSASAVSGTTKQPSSSNKARQRKSKSFSESSSAAAAAAAAAAFNDASLQMFSGGGGAAGSVGGGGGGTTETYLIDRYKYAVRHIQQGLSVEEACNKYRISKGALLKCLSGGTAPRGKKTRLTEMEENGIVEWLINYKDLKYNDAIHLVFEQVSLILSIFKHINIDRHLLVTLTQLS